MSEQSSIEQSSSVSRAQVWTELECEQTVKLRLKVEYTAQTHLCHIRAAGSMPREVQPEFDLGDPPLTGEGRDAVKGGHGLLEGLDLADLGMGGEDKVDKAPTSLAFCSRWAL